MITTVPRKLDKQALLSLLISEIDLRRTTAMFVNIHNDTVHQQLRE